MSGQFSNAVVSTVSTYVRTGNVLRILIAVHFALAICTHFVHDLAATQSGVM